MALKAVLDSLDDVPEALHELYQDKDGVFVLAVDGVDDHPAVKNLKSAHDRTKKDRDAIRKDRDEAKAALEAFGDLTADELEDLRTRAEAGGKAPIKEEIDAMVEKRYGVDRQKLEKQLEALSGERDDFKGKFEQATGALGQERIFNKVKDAAAQAGIRSKALPLVENMARDVWKLDEDGNPVAYNGEEPMMGSTGPVSMADWMDSLKDEHDYLFEQNRGGGAGGSDGEHRPGNGVKRITREQYQSGQFMTEVASGEAVVTD